MYLNTPSIFKVCIIFENKTIKVRIAKPWDLKEFSLFKCRQTKCAHLGSLKFQNYPGKFNNTDSQLSRGKSMKFQFDANVISFLIFFCVKRGNEWLF